MNITLNQASKHIPVLWKHGIVPFLHSSPSLGKSSLSKQLAEQLKLKVIDLRLTELDSTDISGLPYFNDGKAQFMPFDTFPTEHTSIPDGFKGWLLLLDEFNSAHPSVQAACYKLILDKQVGQHKLHPNVAIIACGNLETDNAIVTPMSSALISRFAHFYLKPDVNEWLEWAYKNHINSKITSFIAYRKGMFYTFNPEATKPYACPRTWEMLSNVLKDVEPSLELCSALVGEGVAIDFISYLKVFDKVVRIEDILDNPATVEVPNDMGIRFATACVVCENITKDTAPKLSIYIKRLPSELQYYILKTVKARNSTLISYLDDIISSLVEEIFND